MDDSHILISTRDTLLAAIPFACLFFLSIFRLDQILAAPKGGRRIAPAACGVDEQGEPILCDPDGRLVGPRRSKRGKVPQTIHGKGKIEHVGRAPGPSDPPRLAVEFTFK
jgi:hypothetical protein